MHWLKTHNAGLPTPLYLYNEQTLQQTVADYKQLFPANSRGFYALKANPQPALVQQLSKLGIGAEITGTGEWQASELAGVAASNVLVGGVAKSEAFLRTVCQHGVAAIVIESESEWGRLKGISAEIPPTNILLRINPNVSFGGLNMAGGSQFGLSVEQAQSIAQQSQIVANVTLLGLHFYFGSQRLEVDPILQAVQTVEDILHQFQEAGIRIDVVDLGLGCGVPYLERDKPLDMQNLRTQLHAHWQRPIWDNVEIWFEAGRALVASCGYFIARVIDRKRLHDETFIFLDGGLNVHNPGVGLGRFFHRNPRFCFVTDNQADQTETIAIVGNLCTTADTLGKSVTAPQLVEDDLVIIPNSGAYCQTTAMWGFNSQPLFNEGLLTEQSTLNLFQAQHHFITG